MTTSDVQPEERNRSVVIALLLAICLVAGMALLLAQSPPSRQFCTAEGRINADGSISGRDPNNNCEFSPIG